MPFRLTRLGHRRRRDQQLADYVRAEIPKWAKVIRESGARVD
jgi:hypothetical protein